ncbi:MAG TPA: hypothetical protein VEG27_10775 [Usitatibacter sp.]|nr:hypothetical protein [Usitatibacter sp.]
MSGLPSRGRRLWITAFAAGLLPGLVRAGPPAPGLRTAERRWLERSAELAGEAQRHAVATDFRREIEAHREELRAIVRNDGEKTPASVQQLHRTMILVNALLHAAAECHQGGRLVCPADLMRELVGQVGQGFAQLDAIEKAAG